MNTLNRTISIEDLRTMNQDQIIELYKQGYRIEQNQNLTMLQTGAISSLDTTPVNLGPAGTVIVIAAVLILGYLLLVAKYKIEGSAAKMAGQKYIATSGGGGGGSWF